VLGLLLWGVRGGGEEIGRGGRRTDVFAGAGHFCEVALTCSDDWTHKLSVFPASRASKGNKRAVSRLIAGHDCEV